MSGNVDTALSRYVEFAVATMRDGGVPSDVREAARYQVIDSIGVALAGRDEPSVCAVTDLVSEWGSSGPSRAYGSAPGLQPSHAAFVNGTMAHTLDFDDTHGPSVLHPSASVVSAAIAVGQAVGAPLQTVVDAVALGNELVVRLGMAGTDEKQHNSIFFERGLHATSICGAVGAALAAGLVSAAPSDRVAAAVSIACSLGSGILEANRTGGTVKRIHCGWAAFGGVTAADLARLQLTGPPTVFEGRFGFLQAFCGDDADPSWITRELGSHWEMRRIGFKPYPTNGFTTAAIDSALELRARGVRPADVTAVDLRLPTPVLRTVAEPRDVKIRPTTAYSARFSAPWVFALALRGGGGLGVAVDDFSESSLGDRELLDLAAKVEVGSNEYCDNIFPSNVPAVVTAHLVDSTVHDVVIAHRRGSATNPMTADEIRRKFVSNAARAVGVEKAAALHELLRGPGDIEVKAVVDATFDGALL